VLISINLPYFNHISHIRDKTDTQDMTLIIIQYNHKVNNNCPAFICRLIMQRG